MKIRIECKDYEVTRLPYPLSKVIATLSTSHKDGYFVLDPKEALLTIYEDKKACDRILRDFIDGAANIDPLEESLVTKAINIRVESVPIDLVEKGLVHALIVHIPRELREFEIDDKVGELIWVEGDVVIISAEELIKRIAWSVVYHGLSLKALTGQCKACKE